MNTIRKKKNSDDSISQLISALKNIQDDSQKSLKSASEDIEIEVAPGNTIKMNNRTYYKLMYTDVNNLKKDMESLVTLYTDDINPRLKSVDDNVKKLHDNVVSIKTDVDYLKENKPKTFKTWLAEKSQIAEGTSSIFKFLFYILLILWILSTALPAILQFIGKFIALESGG